MNQMITWHGEPFNVPVMHRFIDRLCKLCRISLTNTDRSTFDLMDMELSLVHRRPMVNLLVLEDFLIEQGADPGESTKDILQARCPKECWHELLDMLAIEEDEL